MKTAVVTTCNAAGWEQYGKRMAQSFAEHWPATVPLLLYAEGFEPDPFELRSSRRDRWLYVSGLPAWWFEFERRHPEPAARGRFGETYNLFMDCVKFGHKVAAWTDAAARNPDLDRLIMADADIVTHAKVDEAWLDALLPEDCYIAWLPRANNYPECGFFILNCKHKAHAAVVVAMRNLYVSGEVFSLAQTHDCMAMQRVIGGLAGRGLLKTHSLSGKYSQTAHPMINGPLGACFDHLKGPRKLIGKSKRSDLVHKRPEEYWR